MPVSKMSPVKTAKKSPAKKSPAKTAKTAKMTPAKRAQLVKVLLGLVAAGGLGAAAYKNRDQIKEAGSNKYRNYFGPSFGPADKFNSIF